ncbi:hypothetical protein EV217_4352 [Phyllobacterium myrsinacearum]|uniref:hypothetical protein n=1 Tax=Phyllobacterium myrsinacearum TaxID=28101 RepID=UPI00102A6A62|nr:hypothetical protein [Phyllobacterium myrsinacearum]RZS77686.1 hypothetical protein EV217_4352 [Phyllobacterium myrsinacearum]
MNRYVTLTPRVIAAVFFCIWLSYCISFRFVTIQDGLDPSWLSAISFAQSRGASFGSDIMFTMGPYMNVLYGYYQGDISKIILIATAVIVLTGTLLIFRIFAKQNALYVVIFLIISAASPGIRDSLLSLIPLIAVYVIYKEDKPNVYITTAVATTFSIITLTKFSATPVVVVAAILIDIIRVSRRQFPVLLISLIASTIIAAKIVDMDVYSLAAYLRSGLDVSSGYADSMNVQGPAWEIWTWLALAATLLLLLFADTVIRHNLRIASLVPSLAPMAMLFIVLLLSMKHGFVRHDGHSLIAWTTLIIAAGATMFVADRPKAKIAVATVAVVALITIHTSPFIRSLNGNGSIAGLPSRLSTGLDEMGELFKFASNPSKWSVTYADAQSKAMAEIAARHPLPEIRGSVDTIPSIQSRVISAGLNFTPRPSIQEYNTYSKALIEANQQFYLSEKSPDNVLFGLESIDNRLPMFSEAALWPLLFERYEPSVLSDDIAILRKRSAPLPALLGPFDTLSGRIGEPVKLPDDGSVVFGKIDISYSLVGKIIKTLFKAPEIYIRLNYADRESEKFRFIPGIAREGFILTPTLKYTNQFVDMAAGNALPVGSARAISFEILGPTWLGRAYNPDFTVQYARLDMKPLKDAATRNSFLQNFSKKTDPLRNIIAENPMHPPMLEVSKEGIYAHSPSQIKVGVSGHRQLNVSFGMRDGSWRDGGSSQGVCFAVETSETHEQIFKRCLMPIQAEQDRGIQSAVIAVPPSTQSVQLRTDCVASCGWGWSYWSEVTPQ